MKMKEFQSVAAKCFLIKGQFRTIMEHFDVMLICTLAVSQSVISYKTLFASEKLNTDDIVWENYVSHFI